MTDENDFVPRLGRIRSRGGRKFDTQLKRLANRARRGQPRSHGKGRLAGGTIVRKGRGKGAAAVAAHWAHKNGRRVIVKVHIARAGTLGNAAFTRHLSYVLREGTEKDGSKGRMYDRSEDEISARDFNHRAREDKRQFRLIVSPEDAGSIEDLKSFTRKLMEQAERDLGTRLDWVAVNHHDTSHPHIHVIVRGGNTRNGELYIDRKYITHGLRHRAEEIVTRELGQKNWREIAANRSVEAAKDAYTSLDRELERAVAGGRLVLQSPATALDRYEIGVKTRRLQHLERLGLARHIQGAEWKLESGWAEMLKSLGRRGDIINSLARKMGERVDINSVREFSPALVPGGEVTGRIAAILPGNELRNGKQVLIEGLDGMHWMVDVGENQALGLPQIGGVISVSAPKAQAKPADRTIAEIAERNDGMYSDELHQAADPGSSPAYRLAHKRRLEALRRLGVVARQTDGSWQIPNNFEAHAREAEAKRRKLSIDVRSWLPIDQLTERRTYTWLDEVHECELGDAMVGFATEVRAARSARRAWVQSEGLNLSARSALEAGELYAVISDETARNGKDYVELSGREVFKGVYSRNLDTAQGRFAVIESEGRFAIAPWALRQEAWRGRRVEIQMSARIVQWRTIEERSLG